MDRDAVLVEDVLPAVRLEEALHRVGDDVLELRGVALVRGADEPEVVGHVPVALGHATWRTTKTCDREKKNVDPSASHYHKFIHSNEPHFTDMYVPRKKSTSMRSGNGAHQHKCETFELQSKTLFFFPIFLRPFDTTHVKHVP